MKAAVAWLQSHMPRVEGPPKGTMLLATVRGDVHDIGKNLVDIILSNNGYRVVNLGIKQPIDHSLKAAAEARADVIGMSGLLVKSTVIMRENLEEMARQGSTTPVVLGGAALTRAYVENECSKAYGRKVTYAKDAFAGLYFMDKLREWDDVLAPDPAPGEASSTPPLPSGAERPLAYDPRDAEPIVAVAPPAMPALGARLAEVPLRALLPWLNEDVLFKFQWGFLRKNLSTEEHAAQLRTVVRPILVELADRASREGILEPRAVYGFFRAHREGDTLVFDDHGVRLRFPRQRPTVGRTGLCLADYVREDADVVGLQLVTVGARATEVGLEWFEANRYTEYLYLHGLAVAATEAHAEYVHMQMRAELGIAGDDAPDIPDLFHKKYRSGCSCGRHQRLPYDVGSPPTARFGGRARRRPPRRGPRRSHRRGAPTIPVHEHPAIPEVGGRDRGALGAVGELHIERVWRVQRGRGASGA